MFLYDKLASGGWEVYKERFPGAEIGDSIHCFSSIAGLNQIRTVFDPDYERYISLYGYDRIQRYYFNEDDVYDN